MSEKSDTDVLFNSCLALAGSLAGKHEVIVSRSGGDPCLEVPAECLAEVAGMVRHDSRFGVNVLACISGLDRYPLEPRFEIVYHLRALSARRRLVIKTRVGGSSPSIPSVTGVWRSADWFEREIYDLLGVSFHGHPDLRRILLPPDWQGHPLRKDFPLEGAAEQEGAS